MSVLVDWNEFALLLASKLQNQTDEAKIISIFKKLKAIPMTLEILKETKIGKIVNSFRKFNNPYICEDAKTLVQDWKKIANDSVEAYKPLSIENTSLNSNNMNDSIEKSKKISLPNLSTITSNNHKIRKENKKEIIRLDDNSSYSELQSSSNPFFKSERKHEIKIKNKLAKKDEEVLPNGERTPNPQILPMEDLLKYTDSNLHNPKPFTTIKNTIIHQGKQPVTNNQIDTIIPDYKPNPKCLLNPPYMSHNKILVGDMNLTKADTPHALDEDLFFQKSKTKTQVYSGRKAVLPFGFQKVPTLHSMCIRILIDNIDSLEYIGGVPAEIIAPVLEKCNPSQLFNLEHYNPKLLEDTDMYWEKHCSREFKKACSHHVKQREEDPGAYMQTWRDLYLEELDLREDRLKKVTANISASIHSKVDTGPRVKLAFMSGTAKPPRNVIRQQAKFSAFSNSSRSLTKNPKFVSIGATKNYEPSNPSPNNVSNTLTGSSRSFNAAQVDPETYSLPRAPHPVKRTAPMMDKTMKFFKRFKMRR